jgi:PAS domain S-box-containing protein
MKGATSTPMIDPVASNAFEADKPGTNARSDAEAFIEELRQKGGIFVDAVRATRMAMVLTDPNLPGNPIIFANQAFLDISGYGMDEVLGQQPYFMNGPETDPKDAERLRRILESDQDGVIETVQYGKNGRRFVAALLLSAFKDEGGRTLNHFLSWFDVTRRVDAEKEADKLRATETALRASEQRLRLIIETAGDYAIFTTDPQGRIQDWLPGAQNVFGWTPEEITGQPIEITYTPEDNDAGVPQWERDQAAAEGRAPNVRWHVRKDGSRVFIDGIAAPLRAADGELIGFMKIGQDTTERRRAQEHERMLLGELQHRVRNTLGVIRSIGRRTAERSETVEDMWSHLEGRIDAFSRVQSVVTRNPEVGLDLKGLIEDELRAHAAREGERVRLAGPDLLLKPRAAETLSLAIHELATNAVKYGALSAATGMLSVTWRRELGRLELAWEEGGLDGLNLTPSRRGFGMELLQRSLPYELDAETRIEFRPQGLRFTLSVPLGPTVLAS